MCIQSGTQLRGFHRGGIVLADAMTFLIIRMAEDPLFSSHPIPSDVQLLGRLKVYLFGDRPCMNLSPFRKKILDNRVSAFPKKMNDISSLQVKWKGSTQPLVSNHILSCQCRFFMIISHNSKRTYRLTSKIPRWSRSMQTWYITMGINVERLKSFPYHTFLPPQIFFRKLVAKNVQAAW